jgi:hypothetical protein
MHYAGRCSTWLAGPLIIIIIIALVMVQRVCPASHYREAQLLVFLIAAAPLRGSSARMIIGGDHF